MRSRFLLPLLVVLGGLLSPSSAAAVPARAAAPAVADPVPAAPWGAPLAGELVLTRPFDLPAGPFAAGHRGADLAATGSSPVLAAGDGVVVFAGMVAGRPVISVDHPGGLRTTYEPVDPIVGAGTRVDRGTPLGVLLPGHPGCPTAACLHWGLRRGETYLDPMTLLRPPRIRLLPWGNAEDPGAAADR
jgi:murein DD-endopeptidase MepM/ murein hydrolase activator NlpD